METKDIIYRLRTDLGLTQDELAEKVFVTRQAVSRWENGETVPNTETLKLLSGLFCVSIDTLLGSHRVSVCQCCGMPMSSSMLGFNKDGSVNGSYCRWCYSDGAFTYSSIDELIDMCAKNMQSDGFTEAQAREHLRKLLPTLEHWKNGTASAEDIELAELKTRLLEEINALGIEGMPKADRLYALAGEFVNLEYPLPSGGSVKLLDDSATYWGTQLESEYGGRCFGAAACRDFIVISSYGIDGSGPELLLYKKR